MLKRRALIVKILRSGLLLLLLMLLALGVLSVNPHWLSPVIEQSLATQGIRLKIAQISANWQGTRYRLHADVAGQAKAAGIGIDKADIAIELDWQAWISGKAFLSTAMLDNSQISIDSQQLKHYLQQQKSSEPLLSKAKIQHYLPLHWQISKTTITLNGQAIDLTASGEQLTNVTVNLLDAHKGQLQLTYSDNSGLLVGKSQHLDLKPFSQYEATLANLVMTIDTRNWWQSHVETLLIYQGLTTKLRLYGEDETLYLQADAEEENIRLSAVPTADYQGAVIRFNELDLSAFAVLKPLLPAGVDWPVIGGYADGEITIQRQQALNMSGDMSGSMSASVSKAAISLADVSAKQGKRAVNHLSGKIDYSNNIVNYDMQLADSKIALPEVFPYGIAPLSGKLAGSVNIAAQSLRLTDIRLSNQDIRQLQASATIDIKRQQLDLSATLDDINLRQRRHYLLPQIPQQLRTWLQSALIAGKKNHTTVTLRGPFQGLFSHKDAVVQVNSRVSDILFHYLPNNPDIRVEQGQVIIDGRQLQVDISKATLSGLPLHATANVDDLLKAVVDVNAHIPPQPAKKIVNIARHSIAADAIKTVEKLIKPDGQVKIDLALDLPIDDKKAPTTFKVLIRGKKASAALVGSPDIGITNAQLYVLVNEQGLQKVTAEGYDTAKKSPVKLAISRSKTGDYIIKLNNKGNALALLQASQLLSKKQANLCKRYRLLTGSSDYQSEVRLDKQGVLQKVTVNSDLQGTAINAFALLVKDKKTVQPVKVVFDAVKPQLRVDMPKRLGLHMLLTKNYALQGLTVSNQQSNLQAKRGEISLLWHGKRFDLATFNRFRQELMPLLAGTQRTAKNTAKNRAKVALQYALDIRLPAVILKKGDEVPIKLAGTLTNLQVSSPLLSGSIHYRPNQLDAELSRVEFSSLFDLVKKNTVNPEGREVTTVDFAKALPKMNITAKQVIWKGNNIGQATIHTSMRNGRYSIDQLLLSGEHYFAEVSGYEAAEPQGITTHTQIILRGEKIKDIIARFKLNPVLDGKFIDIVFNLSWPGKAHTLNLRQSYGKATLKAQNVKMVTISSHAGSVLGLMDIVGILKRISMDFSNLSSSKVSFDVVEGHWNIGGGRAITRDATAKGSLINLQVVGAVDLYRRTFDDVDITVIPKASNVIPLVGAVAGGVAGAAAGFVIQQVVGDDLNRVAGLPYVVSGTWLEPKVTFAGGEHDKSKKPKSTLDFLHRQGQR